MTSGPIERARTQLGLTYKDIARALSVDESTLHRWRARAADEAPLPRSREAGLAHLLDRLVERWGENSPRTVQWLDTPHLACDGATPRQWLRQGRADYLAGLLAGEVDADSRVSRATRPVEVSDALFDLAPVGIALNAPTGEFIAVNRRFCEVLRYDRNEIIGRRFHDITHPDDLVQELDLALRLLAGAIPSYTMQKRYRRSDGRLIWARLTRTLLRDESGVPLHFLAVVDPLPDVEASAIRFALGLAPGTEGATEGVWELDVVSGDVYCSPQIATSLGRAPEDIATSLEDFAKLVHPDDLPATREALDAYVSLRTRSYDIELRMRHVDGSWRWIHSRGRALARDADGRPTRMAGLHSDVTDRREAQERLKESHDALLSSDARLRALVESAAHVLWVTNPDGEPTIPSQTWQAFTGLSAEESRNCGWVEAIHPADREKTISAWNCAVRDRQTFSVEHRVRRYDGVYRWMVVRGAPVLDGEGRVVEWVGTRTEVGNPAFHPDDVAAAT
jgi:PAS domain S-box-containing protein